MFALCLIEYVPSGQVAQVGHEKFKTHITQEAKPKYLILHNSCQMVVIVVIISEGEERNPRES